MDIDSESPLMPTFERVRASFLRRQQEAEHDAKARTAHPFLHSLVRLGYDHEYLRTIVESVIPSLETAFDGKLKTMEFYEALLSELEMVSHNITCYFFLTRAEHPSTRVDYNFVQWGLVLSVALGRYGRV